MEIKNKNKKENNNNIPLLEKLYVLGKIGIKDKITGQLYNGMCVSGNNQGILKLPKILVLNKSPFEKLAAELLKVAKEKGTLKEDAKIVTDLNLIESFNDFERLHILKAVMEDFKNFQKAIISTMGEFNARG